MEVLLKTLRNRKTSTNTFRKISGKLCSKLAFNLSAILRKRHVSSEKIVVIIILRAAIAMLEPVLCQFPKAPVGVLGIKRDEYTFSPRWYYENLPSLSKQSIVIILDPMLATGGSAEAAVLRLIERGAKSENIYFLGIVGAPEGLSRLAYFVPRENIILAAIDRGLDIKKYIVPGLGDFGDRYFGHGGTASFKKLSIK